MNGPNERRTQNNRTQNTELPEVLHSAFCVLYSAFVCLALLIPVRASAQPVDGARYLVIAPDSFVDAVRPLAEWKTLKGVPARIVPLSVTGTSSSQVQAYIRNAWQTWPVKPEYVLIACSPDQLPGYTRDNDCYYGNMTGDYVMEIPVGRLPAKNVYECQTMVAKILAYEQLSGVTDTLWLLKGTTAVSEDDTVNPDQYYLPDSRYVRRQWLDHGFVVAESLYNVTGSTLQEMIDALNDGRAFITYRGVAGGYWWIPWDDFWPDASWHNGIRMPIIISATCQTLTLSPGHSMLGDSCVRFGSPQDLGGAVAFFGTSRSFNSVSQYRSACYRGFFDAIYQEGVTRLGPATLRGRFRVDSLYQDSSHYEEWNLLGDPEMNLWTAIPKLADVVHASAISIGPQTFTVTVTSAGQPVSGALVCLAMDSTVYAADTTGQSGQAAITISPNHPGLMTVVVTGHNLRPHQSRSVVFGTGAADICCLRSIVSDSPPGGNGDTAADQGETVSLPIWLVNYGNNPAAGVSATLRTSDPLATIADSLGNFGDIPGHDSAPMSSSGYHVQFAADCPDAHVVHFDLICHGDRGQTPPGGLRQGSGPTHPTRSTQHPTRFFSSWLTGFDITLHAPIVEFSSIAIEDTTGNNNGILDPNETAVVFVGLLNRGTGPADSVRAILRSGDRRLTVVDSAGDYGTIRAGARQFNFADGFVLAAGSMVPQTQLPCTLIATGPRCRFAVPLNITVGQLGPRDPQCDGPRSPPLYWAYDDCDTSYSSHPSFSWTELRGLGTHLTFLRDSNVVVGLPPEFGPFRYYGRRYTQITISNNGYIVPGATTYINRENVALPTPGNPPMLAADWDAMAPTLGGGVWYADDPANDRFLIEWDSVHYRQPGNLFDKFEIILYDTTIAARDGNNEALFQYLTNNHMNLCTIGIEDPSESIGITALFNGRLATAASPIWPGRAIKFTSDPPFAALAESPTSRLTSSAITSLVTYPNPFRERVEFCIPAAASLIPHSALAVYDVSGRLVRLLPILPRQRSPLLNRNPQSLYWDGKNSHGLPAEAGVYYCRLSPPTSSPETIKLIKLD